MRWFFFSYVRSRQIPLMFERPQWGHVRVTRLRRAENDDFSSSRKVLFLFASSRCCYGCIDHMQHRLFTASVSHGGHLFLLLHSCVLQSKIFRTKKKSFPLSFSGLFLILAISPLHVTAHRWISKLKGYSLHSVWRWLDMQPYVFLFFRVRGHHLSPNESTSLRCFLYSDLFLGPWRMGCCRRRWMNGHTYGFLTWFHFGREKTNQ